jgi:heat shock protein HslJ
VPPSPPDAPLGDATPPDGPLGDATPPDAPLGDATPPDGLLGDATPPDERPPAALLGDWELRRGRGPDGEVVPPAGHPVTLTVDAGRWSGTAACNRYSSTVEVDGEQLAVRGVAVTAMACLDDAVMAAEAAYLAAFTSVDRWSLDGATLYLTGPGVHLGFTRRAAEREAVTLVGTVWQLTMLVTGDDGDDGDDGIGRTGADAELVLSEDGRVSGSTGCNRLMSSFELDGDVLLLGAVATTRMACTDERAARQERAILAVLASERIQIELNGDGLVLRAPDGRALVYRAS